MLFLIAYKEKIIKDFLGGKLIPGIAEDMEISTQTVKGILKRAGLYNPSEKLGKCSLLVFGDYEPLTTVQPKGWF